MRTSPTGRSLVTYFSYKPELFAEPGGDIVDDGVRKFLNAWIDRFAGWIERTSEPRTTAQVDAR